MGAFDPPKPHEEGPFLRAVKAGDLVRVKQMLQEDRFLLFVVDNYYGSPVRAATDLNPQVADYLAHAELEWLREGTIPEGHLYGALHDLGEAAHSSTGYRGCERLRAEAEPVVAKFLAHEDPELRRIAISVLSVHWNLAKYARVLQQMSLDDPDEFIREISLDSMSFLLAGTRDPHAARFLIDVLRDTHQPDAMRQTAYEGLVEVWEGLLAANGIYKKFHQAAFDEGWEALVDWESVDRIQLKLTELP